MTAVGRTAYYGLVMPGVFPNGASLEGIRARTSPEGSADNEVVMVLTNGQEIPLRIKNGTGIAKVEQTTESLEPSGMNEITVTDTDSPAHTYTFSVKNGVGIVKMEQVKSSREGSDTNVFRFTDSEGVEKEFTVYNGNGIAKMEQTVKSEAGSAVNTFEFTDTDGVTKAFDVTNGNGIASIEKTETDEQSGTNTLTITETNGNTTEWHVKNGTGIAKMEQTVKSDSGGDTQVFTFTDSAGNTADFEVKNGIGVEHLAEVDKTVKEFKESVNAAAAEFKESVDTTVKEYTDKMDTLTADAETEGSLDNKLKTTREALQKMLDDFKSESAEKINAMQATIDAIPFTEDGLKTAIDTQVGDRLVAESTTRKNAEKQLQANIDAEKKRVDAMSKKLDDMQAEIDDVPDVTSAVVQDGARRRIFGTFGLLGGAAQASANTMSGVVDEVAMKGGICGGSFTHASGAWYNFLYIPHRIGMTENGASDNHNYGTCLFFDMTSDTSSMWIMHRFNGTNHPARKVL